MLLESIQRQPFRVVIPSAANSVRFQDVTCHQEILNMRLTTAASLGTITRVSPFQRYPANTEPPVRIPLLKLFLDAPPDIFTNGAALFLGKGGQDGHHQLAITAHGMDILFSNQTSMPSALSDAGRYAEGLRCCGQNAGWTWSG